LFHLSSGVIKNFKTLIVEDNASFRRSLKESLETLFPSMIIQEAAEGSEALQKVDTFLPELIFMDIHLPGENGLQLTKKIKVNHPALPIIVLTNYDLPEYREAAFQYGANSFITKDSLNWGEIESLVKSFYSDSSVRGFGSFG
jgi:DNA-binding NarL/FixJ family response regulator